MTHQQMIDFWHNKIQRLETEKEFYTVRYPTILNIYDELIKQATLIYMQLCQMETNQPITLTSTK